MLLLCVGAAGCVSDIDYPDAPVQGTLSLSFGNVSVQSETRSTPAQLGTPVAENFTLSLVGPNGRTYYNGKYTSEDFNLPVGIYTVEAHYGDNPRIALDAPYFQGKVNAEVKKDEHVTAEITAKVANALVSVRFGVDDAETARFNKFYREYALYVYNGDYGIAITNNNPLRSVYFPAGTHPTLRFWGILKDDGREVSLDLSSNDLPTTFNAADHAIVTLTLPDPEMAMTVDISKVEMEEVVLGETIPLSWLPVPKGSATHRYNTAGELVGTDVTFTNCYPHMQWKAVLTKSGSDVVLRTVEGEGELTSLYTSSDGWPFLPAGNYKATFYIITDEGENLVSSRDPIQIPAPSLTPTVDGYTSYTKYQESDVAAANDCDRLTVYEPSVKVNIDETLLANGNYSYSFTYDYNGFSASVPTGKNRYSVDKVEGNAPRANPYVLKAEVSFGGATAEAQKDFYITGLPYLANSEETFADWTAQAKGKWADDSPDNSITAMTDKPGTCYWFKGETSGDLHQKANIYSPKFYIPSGNSVRISTAFDFWYYVASKSVARSDDYRYFYYGPVSSTSETPTATRETPNHNEWTRITNNTYTFTTSTCYLSLQWHYDVYTLIFDFPGYYWWGLNNVSIQYR